MLGGIIACGGIALKGPLGDHLEKKDEDLMKEWRHEEKKEKLRIY